MNKTVKVLLASVALLSSVSATVSVLAQDNGSIAHLQQLKNKEDAERLAAALKPTIDAENNARKVYEARVNEHKQVLNVYNAATEAFRLAEIELKKVRIEAAQDVEKETKRLEGLIAVGNKEKARLTSELEQAKAAYTEAMTVTVPAAQAKLNAAKDKLEDAKKATPQQDIAPFEKAVAVAESALAQAEANYEALLNKAAALSKEIDVYTVRIQEATNAKEALNIDNMVAVVNALNVYHKSEVARKEVAAKLSVTRANLEEAKVALDEAIKANEINHLKNGVPYNKVAPKEVEKTQAEKEAEEVSKKAADKKAGKTTGQSAQTPKTANKSSVAKTATGGKVLPKTSAAN